MVISDLHCVFRGVCVNTYITHIHTHIYGVYVEKERAKKEKGVGEGRRNGKEEILTFSLTK